MRVLALDTASPFPALSLLEDRPGAGSRESVRPLPLAAAEAIAPELDGLLRQEGLSVRDLDRVAVVSGPGSFTGLRAGLAFARGLARALGVGLVVVRTFRAASETLPDPPDADFLLDAGRGDVHRARRRAGVLSEDPVPLPLLRAREEAASDGVPAFDLAAAALPLAPAAARLAREPLSAAPETAPSYGRKSAAEEKLEKESR
jgi:tRNA threonylcarbamoyladenosine biosynthesis protein TsaB